MNNHLSKIVYHYYDQLRIKFPKIYEETGLDIDKIDFNDPVAIQQLMLLAIFSTNMHLEHLLNFWLSAAENQKKYLEQASRMMNMAEDQYKEFKDGEDWKNNKE